MACALGRLSIAAALAAPVAGAPPPAFALEIQKVAGRSGVGAWLAESRQLPMIVIDFAFDGAGSTADAPGSEGLASFAAAMLSRGAGELDAAAFQDRLADIGAVLSFGADRDAVTGHLEVAREHRARAFDLLREALARPRFDAAAVEIVRAARAAELARLETEPSFVAMRAWWKAAFPDHPYGRDPAGTAEANARISADDLRAGFQPRLARDKLLVAAAGDIGRDELAAALDRIFGELPASPRLAPVKPAAFRPFDPVLVRMAFPQSAVVFGQGGVAPDSPQHLPVLLANHLLGAGTLTARLFVELREKRGLVYSVHTEPQSGRHADVILGRFSTENAKLASALEQVRVEWRRLAAGEVSEAEVLAAKSYFKGALPVSLDGTPALAARLLAVRRMGLATDYLVRWRERIDAVEPDAVRSAATRVFSAEALSFAIAGDPPDARP